ncbi:MAG: hypothetical protein L3K06_01840 [Thermoplasmata archaeon]|nr:hypothetical protein [Thermoplasmata archaeon]MCI4354090.1 hypothetical protein [Thermoplasmata archaeon]
MEIASVLHRSPSDRPLPASVFVPVRAAPRRPKVSYRLRIRSAEDVEVARRRGLGLYLLTSEVPTRHHYPMRFPPVLVVDRRLSGLVDAGYRVVPFRSAEALPDPPFEALVAMMLRVDEIAARVMLVRTSVYDPSRLTRFVVAERLEQPATLLRLQQFAPGIPTVGPSMPLAAVREQDRKNPG